MTRIASTISHGSSADLCQMGSNLKDAPSGMLTSAYRDCHPAAWQWDLSLQVGFRPVNRMLFLLKHELPVVHVGFREK